MSLFSPDQARYAHRGQSDKAPPSPPPLLRRPMAAAAFTLTGIVWGLACGLIPEQTVSHPGGNPLVSCLLWTCGGAVIGVAAVLTIRATEASADVVRRAVRAGIFLIVACVSLYRFTDSAVWCLLGGWLAAIGGWFILKQPVEPGEQTIYNDGYLSSRNLNGCRIVAADGQFLGLITDNVADPHSIYNIAGEYGSVDGLHSIHNSTCPYGSVDGPLSAYNVHAQTPPRVISPDGSTVGYLTVNSSISGQIDPHSPRHSPPPMIN
jgi:hypothetical protein